MISDINQQTNQQQNGHSPAQDAHARVYLLALRRGEKPDTMPDVGKWTEPLRSLAEAYDREPDNPIGAVLRAEIDLGIQDAVKKLLSSNPRQQDLNARTYILALRAGEKPATMPDVGKWWQCCGHLARAFDENPDRIEATIVALINSKKYPGLRELLSDDPLQGSEPGADDYSVPPLPPEVKANEAGAELASPTLDALIKYFAYWCTRSYEGYHEGVALWVLDTINARRTVLRWRGGIWTSLYIMLVSKSGFHAKTEAAKYGVKVIRDSDLGFLLMPDETTPQRLLSKMSGKHIPRNYTDMSEKEKEKVRLKLAFSAQKGWCYNEFGDFLHEIMTGRGCNSMFYRLLKQLYDDNPEFTYDTGTRGEENIEMPALSIVGTSTPESLADAPKKVWLDGEFARIAFIVPPLDSKRLDSAPDGEATVPPEIIQALRAWHYSLGIPECQIVDLWEQEEQMEEAHGKDNKKKRQSEQQYKVDRFDKPYPQKEVYWGGTGIREAHEAYYKALVNMESEYHVDPRLNATYIRFPDMALKIAMLLASLENKGRMEMKHWARGQQITERWRADAHGLLAQVSMGTSATPGYGDLEDQIISTLTKLKGKKVLARYISQRTEQLRKLGVPEVRKMCHELKASEVIEREGTSNDKNALFSIPCKES